MSNSPCSDFNQNNQNNQNNLLYVNNFIYKILD